MIFQYAGVFLRRLAPEGGGTKCLLYRCGNKPVDRGKDPQRKKEKQRENTFYNREGSLATGGLRPPAVSSSHFRHRLRRGLRNWRDADVTRAQQRWSLRGLVDGFFGTEYCKPAERIPRLMTPRFVSWWNRNSVRGDRRECPVFNVEEGGCLSSAVRCYGALRLRYGALHWLRILHFSFFVLAK